MWSESRRGGARGTVCSEGNRCFQENTWKLERCEVRVGSLFLSLSCFLLDGKVEQLASSGREKSVMQEREREGGWP